MTYIWLRHFYKCQKNIRKLTCEPDIVEEVANFESVDGAIILVFSDDREPSEIPLISCREINYNL